jgi:DNA repair ATPase RecN
MATYSVKSNALQSLYDESHDIIKKLEEQILVERENLLVLLDAISTMERDIHNELEEFYEQYRQGLITPLEYANKVMVCTMINDI